MTGLLKKDLLRELNKAKALKTGETGGFSPECIKMILHHHNRAHSDKNPIQFVLRKEIQDAINEIASSHTSSKDNRYQLLVMDGGHFSLVDIHYDGKGKSILLDAANDPRYFGLANAIATNKNIDSLCVATGCTKQNLQKASVGCFVFSFAHAKAVQSLDIYGHLKRDEVRSVSMGDKISTVDWKNFPPEIVVYSQSRRCWEQYKSEYQERFHADDSVLSEFTSYRDEMCQRSAEIAPSSAKYPGNFIPFLFQKEILDPVIKYVEEADEKELKEVAGIVMTQDEEEFLRICLDD